jgi:hypothetical protein
MKLAAMAMIALIAPSAGFAQTACPTPLAPATCSAALPSVGAHFSGTVLQVTGGDSLCVALGPTPDQWVPVRIVDASPASTRATMMTAAFASEVACVVSGRSDGAVQAVCTRDGVSITRLAGERLAQN